MPIQTLTTPNGAVALLSSRQMLAGQGKTFVVTEPTLGTGVAYALKTSTSATDNGFLCVSNNNAVGGPSIYFNRLSITETATAPTGTLRMTFEAISETGIVALTGSVASRTPVQINAAYGQGTGAVVQFFSAGAATVPAAVGTRRNLAEIHLDTGVCVAHDTYVVDFGAEGPAITTAGLTAARATAPAAIGTVAPAIVVAPQSTVWLNMYWITAAANTPSFTYMFSYHEL
jgi:hypothetical protein